MPGVIQNRQCKQRLNRREQVAQKRKEAKERRRCFTPGGNIGPQGATSGRPVEEVRDDGFVRHQEIPKAHSDAIMAIVMAEEAIYTASRDKLLKRWKVGRNPTTNRYELNVDLEVNLGDLCWSMVMAGEWIFCGLGDGTIKGFSKSGNQLRFTTKILHCNVDPEGDVSLSPQSGGCTRSPAPSAKEVLSSIVSLLSEPDPDVGLVPEIVHLYRTNRAQHDSLARACARRYAGA